MRIRVENAALAGRCAVREPRRDARPAGRRRRPGRAGHRAVRRPRRPRRASCVEPRRRPDRQGLRRGADARRPSRRWPTLGVRPAGHGRCTASATSTARTSRRGAVPPRARAAVCAVPRCTRALAEARVASRRRRWSGAVRRGRARTRRPRPGRRRSGPLPGRRRRAALADPPRRSGCDAPAPAAGARYGLRRHFAVRAVDGLRRGALVARRGEAYVTPVAAGPGRRRGARPPSRGSFDEPWRASRSSGPAGRGGSGDARCAAPDRCASGRSGRVGRPGAARRRRRRLRRRADRRGHRGRRWPAPGRRAQCLLRDRPSDYERAWRQGPRATGLLTGSLLQARRHRRSGRPLSCRPAHAGWPWAFGTVVRPARRLTGREPADRTGAAAR